MAILKDHIKKKKTLITPFNNIGSSDESDWLRVTMPNLLWISIINHKLGNKVGAEVVAQTLKCITDNQPRPLPNNLHFIGKHNEFICTKETLSLLKQMNLYDLIRSALNDFLVLFPECPLLSSFSLCPCQSANPQDTLVELKSLLDCLYDKTSIVSTFTIVSAVYSMFVCGKLRVTENTILARFPEVIDYPKTEVSQLIASSLRCLINIHDSESSKHDMKQWAANFWNKSYKMEPLTL